MKSETAGAIGGIVGFLIIIIAAFSVSEEDKPEVRERKAEEAFSDWWDAHPNATSEELDEKETELYRRYK